MSEMWRPVAGLILASIAAMGSPGPSTISITAVGASFGINRSLAYAAGLIVGAIAVLGAVSLGAVALILAIPHGAILLGGVSAVYILFLAFKIATAPPLGSGGGTVAAPSFLGGLALAIANPKAYLAIAAVFAGTTIIAWDPRLDALIKTALLAVMIVVIHLFWLVAGASLSRFLRDPTISRIINLALASALVIVTFVALAR